MKFLKLVLNADFLLFILGVYWINIAIYIQTKLAKCNPKLFSIALAALLFAIIQGL